jgi:membrane associated rhomboid family serine protease
MAECDHCGEHENLPYECRHCGGTFCARHRLPENHDCPGLEQWAANPGAGPGGGPTAAGDGVFDSGFDDSVVAEDDGGLAARLGLTGPGSALAYFRGNVTYLFLALMWATFAAQLAVIGLFGQGTMAYLFVLEPSGVLRAWTWVTSVFAHGGFGHIAFNSIALYFFGPIVERRLGSKKFAALFLAAGVAAGLTQVGVRIALSGATGAGVVGASGAIMAVMGVLTVLNPKLKVYLWFVLPMPLWVLTLGFALVSVGLVSQGGIGAGGIAHGAHLAGLAIGLAYGEKLRREGAKAPQSLQLGGGGGPGGPGGPGGGRRRF